MTTTVTVKARAWGAKVEVDGESTELSPNSERNFHVDEGESKSFTVTHGEKPADAVPGSEQNDALVKEVDPAKLAELSGNDAPKGNESGATEVAATTDAKRAK